MGHVVQDMKPFFIAGVEQAVTREGGEGLRAIPKLWETIFENPLFLYIDAHAKTDGLLKNTVVGTCRNRKFHRIYEIPALNSPREALWSTTANF